MPEFKHEHKVENKAGSSCLSSATNLNGHSRPSLMSLGPSPTTDDLKRFRPPCVARPTNDLERESMGG
eukprot:839657-Alexandrium_andersonii.AAC.1